MSVQAFLRELQAASYRDRMVHVERLAPRRATYASLSTPLPEALQEVLARQGIGRFYAHQARAIELALRGQHVVVATGTASGKTLCYNVPVLMRLLEDFRNRALYLFPTKALAQDQLRVLRELTDHPALQRVVFATYDGDTPQHMRARLRRTAHIVLTNPDMLHVGILPNHRAWSRFFSRLRYVVVDEAHAYRGVFGSHVACVLRRLWRVCALYGARPTVVAASATIANPGEHLRRLTGYEFEVVDQDGGPRGERTFVLWNPPCLTPSCEARRSANIEAAELMAAMVQFGLRPIVFARARKVAELILIYARQRLERQDPELADRIAAYRAGYLPEQRRAIERRLFQGELLGVTATNALELGIDVGTLDAVVMVGYPGTIASTWQQAGRAGRGTREGLAVLIGQDNPLDQYLMRHPEALFGRPVEQALIDPENTYVLSDHLACAAYEHPLNEADRALFGSSFDHVAATLVHLGTLADRGGRLFYARRDYPAERVSIRSMGGAPYVLSVRDPASGQRRIIETVEAETAFERVHPGAIYLHQGETYWVEALDVERRVAWLVPVEVDYYTQPRVFTDVQLVRAWESRQVGATTAHVGEIQVTTQVVGYRRLRQFSEEVIGEEELDLPPTQFPTVGVWWNVPAMWAPRLVAQGADFEGALHAFEHAAIGLLPLFAMCDRWDIGGASTALHPDTGTPLICVYDGHPGGVGIAERGFEVLETWWEAVLDLLKTCPCEEGCPACVQSPKCGNNNMPLDKQGAALLGHLLLNKNTTDYQLTN